MYREAYSVNRTMKTKEERFFVIQKYFDLKDQAFADRLHLTRDNIAKIKKGQKIGSRTQEKLFLYFPEISKDWFELGRGEMLNEVVEIAKEPEIPYQKSHDGLAPIITDAKKAFIKYYEQMDLINKLMSSKQDEFIEVYHFLNKTK